MLPCGGAVLSPRAHLAKRKVPWGRMQASDATAQYACDADGRVNMSAAIARSDLIAYLVGASGCG
jgi:hypothetical protein